MDELINNGWFASAIEKVQNLDDTQDKTEIYNAVTLMLTGAAIMALDEFQSDLRHIFLEMCDGNDYNTVCLLEIDSAIECLFDVFVAELKKKYTEGEG